MKDPIFDGEIHIIDEKYAYMTERIDKSLDEEHLYKKMDNFIFKYAEYLYENDKDKVMNYLIKSLTQEVGLSCTPEDYKIIFKPYINDRLNQFATLTLKFIRAVKDNLIGDH